MAPLGPIGRHGARNLRRPPSVASTANYISWWDHDFGTTPLRGDGSRRERVASSPRTGMGGAEAVTSAAALMPP